VGFLLFGDRTHGHAQLNKNAIGGLANGRSSDTRKVKEKSFPGRLGRSDCTAIGGAGEVGRAKACGMVRHDKNRLEDLQWQLLPLYLEQNQFHFRADF
jgi:hypothetical protein